MSYLEKRNEIDRLKQAIDAHGELSSELKNRINYKFRLDWNYYSNSMEGNTLTMDETRSVMIGNLTVGGKPIKDVLEMKGHDDVVHEILSVGKGEKRLSESRIKQIHKGIMHEETEEERQLIGVWKKQPNYVYNYKKERFDFAAPEEVPELMHKLLDRTNAAIDAIAANKKNAPHPIDVAFQFHLEYVRIHPFYDGNGRTARILTNLLLIAFGYPPFWIKTDEREIYNRYIADIQAYGGDAELFFEFAAGLIVRSQQIMLDAIEGKNISEPNDIDKIIQKAKVQLESALSASDVVLNGEVAVRFLDGLIIPTLRHVQNKLSNFDRYFIDKTFVCELQVDKDIYSLNITGNDSFEANVMSLSKLVNEHNAIAYLQVKLTETFHRFGHHQDAGNLQFQIIFTLSKTHAELHFVPNPDSTYLRVPYTNKHNPYQFNTIRSHIDEFIVSFIDLITKTLT